MERLSWRKRDFRSRNWKAWTRSLRRVAASRACRSLQLVKLFRQANRVEDRKTRVRRNLPCSKPAAKSKFIFEQPAFVFRRLLAPIYEDFFRGWLRGQDSRAALGLFSGAKRLGLG